MIARKALAHINDGFDDEYNALEYMGKGLQ